MLRINFNSATSEYYQFLMGRGSESSQKTLAANAAAAASKAVQSGKTGFDESIQRLSKRDISFFGSETFQKILERIMAKRELSVSKEARKAYRKLCEDRSNTWYLTTEIPEAKRLAFMVFLEILMDMRNTEFNWSFGQVKDTFCGYRSEAYREIENSKGFNKTFYVQVKNYLNEGLNSKTLRKLVKVLNSNESFEGTEEQWLVRRLASCCEITEA